MNRRTVLAAALLVVLAACAKDKGSPAPTTSSSAPGASSTSTTAGAGTSTTGPTSSTAPTSTTSPFGTTFAYQPLWPFRTLADAAAWQRDGLPNGRMTFLLDAGDTAVAFAKGHLGFTEIDRVTSKAFGADGAHIGVGYPTEGGRTGTAAVVHLLQLGTGTNAPWEVVGTDDTTFTLTTPAYASKVASPVTVGGTITGVDESIHVEVRQASSDQLLGERCCLPAGGERSPWQAAVSFTGATDGVITIVASTGGHLQRVERFAITGLRV